MRRVRVAACRLVLGWREWLRAAVMAVGAAAVVVAAGMLELLAGGCELVEFVPCPLREDGVAGVAVVRLDGLAQIRRLMQPVVTAETAREDHVTYVVGIGTPVSFHFGKEVIGVDFLKGGGGGFDSFVIRILSGECGGDAGLGFNGGLISASKDEHGVGFDPRNGGVYLVESHRLVDGFLRR